MGRLIYAMLASVDGYVEDDDGGFGWAAPDAEVHAFVNGIMRRAGTHLYGRRMYEVMHVWEGLRERTDLPEAQREFADLWHDADKVVYSDTLPEVTTARTRLERAFAPAAVRELKRSAARDVSVSGPALAATAIAAGLVDEIHLFLVPVAVGSGKPALPTGGQLQLELVEQRRFGNGTVHLHYRPSS